MHRSICQLDDRAANLGTCCALYPADVDAFSNIEEVGCRRVTHTVGEGAWLSTPVVIAPLRDEIDENLIVQIPHAHLVFGGAMCSFGVTPMAGSGDPAGWADALDRSL